MSSSSSSPSSVAAQAVSAPRPSPDGEERATNPAAPSPDGGGSKRPLDESRVSPSPKKPKTAQAKEAEQAKRRETLRRKEGLAKKNAKAYKQMMDSADLDLLTFFVHLYSINQAAGKTDKLEVHVLAKAAKALFVAIGPRALTPVSRLSRESVMALLIFVSRKLTTGQHDVALPAGGPTAHIAAVLMALVTVVRQRHDGHAASPVVVCIPTACSDECLALAKPLTEDTAQVWDGETTDDASCASILFVCDPSADQLKVMLAFFKPTNLVVCSPFLLLGAAIATKEFTAALVAAGTDVVVVSTAVGRGLERQRNLAALTGPRIPIQPLAKGQYPVCREAAMAVGGVQTPQRVLERALFGGSLLNHQNKPKVQALVAEIMQGAPTATLSDRLRVIRDEQFKGDEKFFNAIGTSVGRLAKGGTCVCCFEPMTEDASVPLSCCGRKGLPTIAAHKGCTQQVGDKHRTKRGCPSCYDLGATPAAPLAAGAPKKGGKATILGRLAAVVGSGDLVLYESPNLTPYVRAAVDEQCGTMTAAECLATPFTAPTLSGVSGVVVVGNLGPLTMLALQRMAAQWRAPLTYTHVAPPPMPPTAA